jgi:putative flippase GtrA
VVDSARIYAPLVRFAASSLLAFVVDTVALLALVALTGNLLVAVLGARLLSSSVNFVVNRWLVFSGGRRKPLRAAAAQYWTLAATLLAANFGLLSAMIGLGVGLLPAKIVTELAMVVASYQLQRTVVFAQPVADRLPHDDAPQSGRTAATALTSMRAPGTPSPETRAAVTSAGAPGPASRGAMAPYAAARSASAAMSTVHCTTSPSVAPAASSAMATFSTAHTDCSATSSDTTAPDSSTPF